MLSVCQMNLGNSLSKSQLVIQVYSETANPNANNFHSSTASHQTKLTVDLGTSVFHQSKTMSVQRVKVTQICSGFRTRGILQHKKTGTNSLRGSMKVYFPTGSFTATCCCFVSAERQDPSMQWQFACSRHVYIAIGTGWQPQICKVFQLCFLCFCMVLLIQHISIPVSAAKRVFQCSLYWAIPLPCIAIGLQLKETPSVPNYSACCYKCPQLSCILD